MRLLILLCVIGLTACSPDPETVFIRTDVPAELLRPVAVPNKPVSTVNDLAERAVELRRGLDQANGQIGAIAEIVGPQ